MEAIKQGKVRGGSTLPHTCISFSLNDCLGLICYLPHGHVVTCETMQISNRHPLQPSASSSPHPIRRNAIASASKGTAAPVVSESLAPKQTELVPVEIPGRRQEDGTPIIRLVPIEHAVLVDEEEEPGMDASQLLHDVHRMRQSRPFEAEKALSSVQVPDHRMLDDPASLELIGDGLPIIRGVSW